MGKPWSYARGWWGRNSSGKRVSGCELDIDMSLREEEDLKSWRRVVGAAYIPTNEQNHLRQDIAAEMGLDTREGAVVVLYWKLAHSQKAYKYKNDFNVKLELPCEVIFGKQSKSTRLEGFPTQFEKGKKCRPKHDFGESYNFSQRRTNSWGRLKESLSWGSLGSDKSRRLSFLQRKSQPSPHTACTKDAVPPQASDTGAQVQEVHEVQATKKGVSHQNATGGPNGESRIESTAKLPAEDSTVNENRSSQFFDSGGLIEDVSGFRSIPSKTKTYEEIGDREIGPMGENSQVLLTSENSKQGASHLEFRDELSLEPRSVESSGQGFLESNQSLQENQEAGAKFANRLVENTKRDAALARPLRPTESSGNGEKKGLSIHSQDTTPDLTNEPVSSSGVVENAQPSQLAIETHARNAGKIQQWKLSELKLENDTVSQPSTTYAESSSEMALNPPATPDSPLSQGNLTSLEGRFPERVLDSTLQKNSSPRPGKDIASQDDAPPGVGNGSENLLKLSKQQDAKAKIRARKRGKAPKIRRVKLDLSKASENMEMTPAPGASEDWTYDPSSKGHWHIDSDTGSTIWYSDAESEQSDD